MSFQSTASSHHLKFLGLALLLLCIWFLYPISDTYMRRYHISAPSLLSSFSSSPSPSSSFMELLPAPYAEQYFLARRLKPYLHRQGHRKVYDLLMMYVHPNGISCLESRALNRQTLMNTSNTELEWLEIRSK